MGSDGIWGADAVLRGRISLAGYRNVSGLERTTPRTVIGDETSPDGAASKLKVKLLGRIDLNGHYLEAYEEEDDQRGKRFRLRSFPPIGPESEAGLIRYLVREGFIEKRWPGLSAHIQEEARWAFML